MPMKGLWTRTVRSALIKLWRVLWAPPRSAFVLGATSLALLILKIGVLDSVPEWFDGAAIWGSLWQELLTATVAAYLFFLFTIQLPSLREKKTVGPSVVAYARQASVHARRFLDVCLEDIEHRILEEEVTEDLIRKLFSKIAPSAQSSRQDIVNGEWKHVRWIDLIASYDAACLEEIDRVYRYSRFVEPELLAHLERLRFSTLSYWMTSVRGRTEYTVSKILGNPDMTPLVKPYLDYYKYALAVTEYINRYQAKYDIPSYGS